VTEENFTTSTLTVGKNRFMFGQFSKSLPEVQGELVRFVREVAPHVDYASIIVNIYLPGDHVKKHSDGNLLPLHLSARFGVDAVGRGVELHRPAGRGGCLYHARERRAL